MKSKYELMMKKGEFSFKFLESELLRLMKDRYCFETGHKLDKKSFTDDEKELIILSIGLYKDILLESVNE